MKIFAHLCFEALVGALVFGGCAQQVHPTQASASTKPEGSRLSKAEAIHLAELAAERQGEALRSYKEPKAHYEFIRKDGSWFVFFDGRVAMPGNHFSVWVNDQTGETRFFGGE